MATIYISSTFNDLRDFRDAVISTLRQMGHSIVSMEDYTATGRYSPLRKCLDDVARCDYYVGIFAWRYGYVPPEENPMHKAITELEYRKARDMDKPSFVFLLDESVNWSEDFKDSHTSENKSGTCINELREELGRDKVTRFFKTSDELAGFAAAAIGRWEADEPQRQQTQYVDSTRLEEIKFDTQSINSLNASLKLAQEMQNAGTLSEKQETRFKHLKRESQEVARLNSRIEELEHQAKVLVSEIRTQLEQESRDLAREIAQYGRENIDLKRLEAYERLNAMVSKFELELERGKEIARWIKNRRRELVEDSIQGAIHILSNDSALLQRLENDEQLSILRREIEQYLRRIATALTLGRTNLLDEARSLNQFPKILYQEIFEYIKVRKVQKSSGLLQTQKDLLAFYIDHLIEYVFIEF